MCPIVHNYVLYMYMHTMFIHFQVSVHRQAGNDGYLLVMKGEALLCYRRITSLACHYYSGAPERILSRCNTALVNGKVVV